MNPNRPKPPEPVKTPCTDEQLKAMRDAVYPATSENSIQTRATWESIKHHWRKDEAWLTEQYYKLKA